MPEAGILNLLLGPLGLLAGTILAVVAFQREWVVSGQAHRRQIEEAQKREDEWRELALRGAKITEGAIGLAGQDATGRT